MLLCSPESYILSSKVKGQRSRSTVLTSQHNMNSVLQQYKIISNILMLITVPYSIPLQAYTSSIATSGDWSPNCMSHKGSSSLSFVCLWSCICYQKNWKTCISQFYRKHTSCNTMICIRNWRQSRKWLVPIPVNCCFLQYDSAATKTGKDIETFGSINRR